VADTSEQYNSTAVSDIKIVHAFGVATKMNGKGPILVRGTGTIIYTVRVVFVFLAITIHVVKTD
jgi:hypothetical protein